MVSLALPTEAFEKRDRSVFGRLVFFFSPWTSGLAAAGICVISRGNWLSVKSSRRRSAVDQPSWCPAAVPLVCGAWLPICPSASVTFLGRQHAHSSWSPSHTRLVAAVAPSNWLPQCTIVCICYCPGPPSSGQSVHRATELH